VGERRGSGVRLVTPCSKCLTGRGTEGAVGAARASCGVSFVSGSLTVMTSDNNGSSNKASDVGSGLSCQRVPRATEAGNVPARDRVTGRFQGRVPMLKEDGRYTIQDRSEQSGKRQMRQDDQRFLLVSAWVLDVDIALTCM